MVKGFYIAIITLCFRGRSKHPHTLFYLVTSLSKWRWCDDSRAPDFLGYRATCHWGAGVNSTAPVSIGGSHTSVNLYTILLDSIFKTHPLCVPDSLGIHQPWKVSLRRVSENNYRNFAKMWDKTLLFLQSAAEAEMIAKQYTRDWEVA